MEIVLVHTANEEILNQQNQLNIGKNLAAQKKDHTPLPNVIYLRNVRLVQHTKINQYNTTYY